MAVSRLCQLFAVAVMTGCTATTASASPPPTATANPTATSAPATLTIEQGVQADGPGESVNEALARGGGPMNLVNGTMLKDANGRVWLCEALVKSSPPECAEPRLLVLNMSAEDTTFQEQGVHVADGVRWVDGVQLFGFVRRS